MKINPIDIIIDKKIKLDKKFYFISGNEITLMEKIKSVLKNSLKQENILSFENIKSILSINNDISLFAKNKLFLVNELAGVNGEILDNLSTKEDVYIFFSENNNKIKSIKNLFLQRKDSYLIDCYELSKESKIKIINNFINLYDVELDQEAFWKLLEKLDNKYMLLENELGKIKDFKNSKLSLEEINKIISREDTFSENIFFNILNSNEIIINKYNTHITNNIEVNSLYYTFKYFSYLVFNNNNIVSFEKNIPKYLFKEKIFLIDFYKRINLNKKKMLLNLLFKTENVIRRNGNLSIVLGLRFLLSYKRIITSLNVS